MADRPLVGWVGDNWSQRTSNRSYPDIANTVAEEWIPRLHRAYAPGVLAAIAPQQVIPSSTAQDVGKLCRALVQRHVPRFGVQIMRTWEKDGHIHRPDEAA